MKKVLFLAYFFPPIGGSGVQRSIKYVHYLPQYDYMPVIVTAPGHSDDRWTPDDRSLLAEVSSQVPVYRLKSYYVKDSNRSAKIKRLLHLNSNFSRWWIEESKKIAEHAILKEDIKVIYASMSPFESADVAAELSVKYGLPWIADLRDPWALREVEIYPSFIHRLLELRKMYSRLSTASAIIMNTPEAEKALKKRFPQLKAKIITAITNGFDQRDFIGTVPTKHNAKFRIVYTGTFYSDAGLAQAGKRTLYRILGSIYNGSNLLTRSPYYLLNALKIWVNQDSSIRKHLEIIFAGVPTEKDINMVQEKGFDDVIQFTGYIPHKETISLMLSANLLFCCMHNVAEGKRATTVGGKDYEYMASGRPILAAVPEGDAKDFLSKNGTAFICRPDDDNEMARILAQIYSAWKRGECIVSPDKIYLEQFERRNLTKRLASVFDRVLEVV